MERNDGTDGDFIGRSAGPTLGYVATTRPSLEKALGGVVHAEAADAFAAIDALGDAGSAFQVHEVMVYVSREPVKRA